MDTRSHSSRKIGTGLSESELECLLNQTQTKEKILQEQTEALARERETFRVEKQQMVREREILAREAQKISESREELDREKESLEILRESVENINARSPVKEIDCDNNDNAHKQRNPILKVSDKTNLETRDEPNTELEQLKAELAALRTSIPHLATNALPNSYEETGKFNNYDNRYEIGPPRTSLREALEVIPTYDGKNMSLTQFLRACRRAKDMLPPASERYLAQNIYFKLRGLAVHAVEEESCRSINDIAEQLSYSLGTRMSVDECRAELRKVYQRDNEHILSYIGRVREIKATLLETERRDRGTVHPNELRYIEEIAVTSFCHGLIPIIRAGMSLTGYDSLADAFAHAQTVTAIHETGEERRRRDRRERGQISNERAVAHSTPPKLPPPQPLAIEYRQRYDRARDEDNRPRAQFYERPYVRERDRDPRINPRPPQSNRQYDISTQRNARNSDSTFCRYCKETGHLIEECQLRIRNNKLRQAGNYYRLPNTTDAVREEASKTEERPNEETSKKPPLPTQ